MENGGIALEGVRVVCDAMLGTLARWLRVLGVDASYSRAEDEHLLARARLEGRVLITADVALAERATRKGVQAVLVAPERLEAQLRTILVELRPRLDPFTRCLRCNVGLVQASREEVVDKVPPRVLRWAGRFARCPSCGKIFWPGTHVDGMRARLVRILREASSDPGGEPGEGVGEVSGDPSRGDSGWSGGKGP